MEPFVFASLILFLSLAGNPVGRETAPVAYARPNQQVQKSWEAERDKAYARQQFTKNFRDIQLLGQKLLREHDAKQLTAAQLAKDAKMIRKCALALRSLMALGSLASAIEINKDIDSPQKYDQSIRKLAKLIWDFAHNPHHQNSKVFDTNRAAQVQTDLLTIINLAKAIEGKAKGYVPHSDLAQ